MGKYTASIQYNNYALFHDQSCTVDVFTDRSAVEIIVWREI
jgi:hypothetical protein